MSKKISGIVEKKSDAEKLAELRSKPVDVPTIPTVTPEDLKAVLEANPELVKEVFMKLNPGFKTATKRTYDAGSPTAKATVTKSAQRAAFVEFKFDGKPDEAIRNILKNAGFRFSKFNGVWYGAAAALANHERFGADVQAALAK